MHLSLRQLLREPPHWSHGPRHGNGSVFVCENPTVIAIAADRLGAGCAPMVCTDGMPAAAQRTVLAQLAAAGAVLRYHGDFDWPGLRIGNFVMRSFGAHPWRFSSNDYLAVVGSQADRIPNRRTLSGTRVEAMWDAGLASLMAQMGCAIDEEAVADQLLTDLQPS